MQIAWLLWLWLAARGSARLAYFVGANRLSYSDAFGLISKQHRGRCARSQHS